MFLTPAEQYLAAQIGVSEDEFIRFKIELEKSSKIEPGKPQAGLETLLTISLVSTLLSVGFAIAASFFKPKGGGGPPEIRNTVSDPINRTANQRFVPRLGFDASQAPVNLGDTIPVVYGLQTFRGELLPPERRPGLYGGVRVNMPLLWSNMVTIDGSMMLRAIFAISESRIKTLDRNSFAIGDNLISAYFNNNTSLVDSSSRYTIYFKEDTGRIQGFPDYYRGKEQYLDPGNSELKGGPDVFCVDTPDSPTPKPIYSYVSKPSTQTVFGLYSHAPNFFGLRTSVRLRPSLSIQTKAQGRDRFRVEVVDDGQALADMWQGKYMYSYRMGIVGSSGGSETPTSHPNFFSYGQEFTYTIQRESDQNTQIYMDVFNTNAAFVTNPQGLPPAGISKLTNVAATVAAKQKTVADSFNVGELYMCGTALFVLISKSPDNAPFVSDSDTIPYGGGQTVNYVFQCVKPGYVGPFSTTEYLVPSYTGQLIRPPYYFPFFDFGSLVDKDFWFTASNRGQIFKVAIATIRLPRETNIISLGIRSTVGIRINNITNFKDTLPLFWINWNAGSRYFNGVFNSDATLFTSTASTGSINANETRYSFWKVSFRLAGQNDFFEFPAFVGVRGNSGEAIYNFVSMKMPYVTNWDVRLEPAPSYEIRHLSGGRPFIVLDSTLNSTLTYGANVPVIGYVLIKWNGVFLPPVGAGLSPTQFRLNSIEPNVNLLRYTEGTSMFGEWMAIDEACVYEEVSTTVGNSPEHEVVIINNISNNDVYKEPGDPLNRDIELVPQYDDISKVGINIQASLEWQQFNQFSVFVREGREVPLLLASDAIGPANLFPDVFRDLLLNKRFGAGNIVTDFNINRQDFEDAARYNNDNLYFFDGAVTDKVNLRQWGADTAAHYLLELLQIEGQFSLKPLLPPFDSPVPINGLFNAGNIKKGSFSLEFIDDEERQPIAINIKYRATRESLDYYSANAVIGFPEEVQIYVREANTPDSVPVESVDITAYGTNPWHAIDVACAFIRIRSLVTHKIKFTTGLGGIDKPITAGVYIKVPVDYTSYNEFSSGIILNDGLVVTSIPGAIPDGVYTMATWDFTDNEVIDQTVTVVNGYADISNVLISIPTTTTEENVYKIESVVIDDDGGVVVEAVHSPVDSNGYSLLTKNWTTYKNDANWIVEPGFALPTPLVLGPPPD